MNKGFILATLIFFIAPMFALAQEKETEPVVSSAGFSKVIDMIERFRLNTAGKLQVQKEAFDVKANPGEVSQDLDEDETTNYVIEGSSDKMIEPIFKVLAFIFSGLVIIFSKAVTFYTVLAFFVFILLRYLWRRAV